MNKNNEKGFTLVESLAVLIIGSIVMIFAVNLISNGIENSNQIKERTSIQIEANLILVTLREFHERGNSYTIYFIDNDLVIEETGTGNNKTIFNRFEYSINNKKNGVVADISPKTNSDKTFNIELIITSYDYPLIKHTTQTKLQRL